MSRVMTMTELIITPDKIHPSHDVREEDILGIISDPVCQLCRVAVYGPRASALLEPCKPVERKP